MHSYTSVSSFRYCLSLFAHNLSQQHLATKLDDFATRDIIYAGNDRCIQWVFFGLSTSEPADPHIVFSRCAPQPFNRFSRVIWEHALFDQLLYMSRFKENDKPEHTYVPDTNALDQIMKLSCMKSVSSTVICAIHSSLTLFPDHLSCPRRLASAYEQILRR